MKLQVVKLGGTKFPEYDQAVARLHQRVSPMAKVESTVIRATQTGDAKKDEKITRQLEKLLFTGPDHHVWALDEGGAMLTSPEWAKRLDKAQANPAIKQLSLVVGGPYGLPAAFRARCQQQIALSPMVFTSDLAWLVLWEQIYRGFSILAGSPYHHGDRL